MSVEQKLERIAALHAVGGSAIERSIERARDALLARQDASGHWLFELEADCTIPAEFILMMHFLDEIDAALEPKLALFLRERQADHGGWPLYDGGSFDLSCSVKAYYALKLAGDDPQAPHMVRARTAILQFGGAARANVFTRLALAMFGQLPWRGVPYIPVEIMLLPKWFPFHLDKVSYWSRTVMVPLFILCTRKPVARNPRDVHIRELFTIPPEEERGYLRRKGWLAKVFLAADRLGRLIDPLIPDRMRERATRLAENWVLERLNGEDGLGAIFPAMANSVMAMECLGYAKDDPRLVIAKQSLAKLVIEDDDKDVYVQPCVSPVWDTGLAAHAMLEVSEVRNGGEASPAAKRAAAAASDWLISKQELDLVGDWADNRPGVRPGGWVRAAQPLVQSEEPDPGSVWLRRPAGRRSRARRLAQRRRPAAG